MNEREVFIAALHIESAAQRRDYLDAACKGDEELRLGVEALLAAHERSGSFLEHPLAGPVVTVDDPIRERPGTIIGPYKLMEQIGEGGMGLVFVAEQQRPVRRKVALKVIKPGMDTRQVVARFEAERQALALMDHPNIAKVLDGGTTDSGRPYFVMELVKGVSITEYCDQNQVSIRQRLELFVSVCQAVQHAHQKGIIHRDLKPSNVLVVSHDGTPVVKIIDFGVAKAIGQQLTDKTIYTQFSQMLGTPLYMSPEQAGQSGLDVDTRSDLYSLGVLLYELLTGTTPFDKERLRELGYDEMRRIIREEEPPKPSTRISTLGKAATAVSMQRQSEPKQLRRLIRGELDWIVMKALEKDRNRRYETANGLAMDVQRYLHDEPVLACPPSPWYRFQKFARRNKGRLAVAVLVLFFLASLGGVAGWTALQQATQRAARESRVSAGVAEALRETREWVEKAWSLADYPERMQVATDAAVAALRRGDDFASEGAPDEVARDLASAHREVEELSRHTRMLQALIAIGQKFAEESTGQGWPMRQFYSRMAEAFREFGLDPLHDPVDEVANAVASSRLRDVLLDELDAWHWHRGGDRLGQVTRSARQKLGGVYARWQKLRDAWDVQGMVAFATSPDGLSLGRRNIGAVSRDLRDAKQYAACRTFMRAVVERYPDSDWSHFDLAGICLAMDPPEYAEALRHCSAAAALRPQSAVFQLRLGDCYAGLGAYDQAAACYRKCIELGHGAVAGYIQLGLVLAKKKDWDGAVAVVREAIHRQPKYGPAYSHLAVTLQEAGRHAEALKAMMDAIREHPDLAAEPRFYLRYNAACFAMNYANGLGVNAPPEAERPTYRKQALDFLTADLAAIRKVAAKDPAQGHKLMQVWLGDKDLDSARQPAAVERLPPDERDAWNKLWADVRALRDQTAPRSAGATQQPDRGGGTGKQRE
jgi:serine/threonine protein kinase/tetratricopeptide (TPR) repeat protein